jgi:Protein of unknown function (DUF2652)
LENRGLLFIPDISGFTRFVTETEIDHSRLIIQEILELLINANNSGLEISEIEGDAILFYKFGEVPNLEEIYSQVKKMFNEFQKYLSSYDNRKYCQCYACTSAIGLTLKIITHYGEFTQYKVKNFNKLIGKDVILAHQLLKNEIEHHEYWLVTPQLAGENIPPAEFANWMKWGSSIKKTESGEVTFYFTQLGELKNEIEFEPFTQLELPDKIKMFSFSQEYNTDIITLFHATGDFNYRNQWMEGVKSVEEVNHFLPRVGMKCRCVFENGESILYSSSYSYTQGKIVFSETDEQKKSSVYFTLESLADKKTRLKIDYYIYPGILPRFLFNLSKRKQLEGRYKKSLNNLIELLKEIKLPSLQ